MVKSTVFKTKKAGEVPFTVPVTSKSLPNPNVLNMGKSVYLFA